MSDEQKQDLDEETVNALVKVIEWVDQIKSSQSYNDEIGVLIDRSKRTPDEALEACRRANNRTAQSVKRELYKYLHSS